jgi:diacylglycerol kinase (ATP)
MRVLLLHNPEAGDGPDRRAHLIDLLRAHGHEPLYRSTKEPGWKGALQADCDLIAIAGGDGTVAKVLRRLDPDRPPVAIIPGGSANNIGTCLGIGPDVETWVAGWESARRSRFAVPSLSAGGRQSRFVEAAGLGVFSAVIAAAEEDEPRGEAKVALGALAFVDQLRTAEPRRWHVDIDGDRVEVEALMLEVLNIPRIGPRLDLSPGMVPGTGTVDVVFVPAASRRVLIEALLDATAVPAGALQRFRGRNVLIDPGSDALHVDDEVWSAPGRGARDVRIRSCDAALTVLQPE